MCQTPVFQFVNPRRSVERHMTALLPRLFAYPVEEAFIESCANAWDKIRLTFVGLLSASERDMSLVSNALNGTPLMQEEVDRLGRVFECGRNPARIHHILENIRLFHAILLGWRSEDYPEEEGQRNG